MNAAHRYCLLLLFLIALASRAGANDSIPGAPQDKPVALVGGTIHPVTSASIENATLLFDDGRIAAIGKDAKLPEGTQHVDISGRHVYPGLFAAYSRVGLVEIGAVRAMRDVNETGKLNPNARAEVAVNPDSEIIPVTRSNGVLLALSAPGGGLISGTSAVLQLDGWTWEDMTLRAPAAMHFQWPQMAPLTAWWIEKSQKDQIDERDEHLHELRQAFDHARAYLKARRAANGQPGPPRDSRWEAMIPVLERKTPLAIHADRIEQIQAAVAFAEQQQVRLIIIGGYDAPLCADLLKKNSVPVIISSVYRLPLRRSEDYDAPFTLPARLAKLGVTYCIAGQPPFHRGNNRNLPYHAATAAAYGLARDEALRAITLYPAQILGVDDRVGSLEKGKDATLIITTGDPLETATQVEAAYIQGRAVDLSDRHKRLWKKYQEKYRRQEVKGRKADN